MARLTIYIQGASCALLFATLFACGGGSGGPGPVPVNNTAPVISGDPSKSVRIGESYGFSPSAKDAEGDNLVFSATNLPDWLRIDSATGSLIGSPGDNDVGAHREISVSVSDGYVSSALPEFSIEVLSPLLGESNFNSLGTLVPNGNGSQSIGDLEVLIPGSESRNFVDADIYLEFDNEGNLAEFFGETIVPTSNAPGIALEGEPPRADARLYWGREINEDEYFNVNLKDDRQYFVYTLGTEVNIVLGNENGEEKKDRLTISTPLSGKVILIEDVYDPMLYVYGDIPFVGTGGAGRSLNGLLPYVPWLPNSEIKEFDGYVLQHGTVSFSAGKVGKGEKAVEVFDFLNFTGERVEKPVELQLWDSVAAFENPFKTDVEYKLGLNGKIQFAFSVLGFGLFSFDVAEGSMMYDVGFDHQSLAIRTLIDPDMDWAPQWMTFVADSQLDAEFIVTGEPTLDMNVTGSYRSTLPRANVSGTIHADLDEVTLSGEIIDRIRVPLSVTFKDNATYGSVGINVDYSAEINQSVSAGFDRAEQAYVDAVAELESAIGDYEFEVSLQGFRELIPPLVDEITARLEAIPGQLRVEVDNAVVEGIKNKKEVCKEFTFKILGVTVTKTFCATPADYVDENTIGEEAGNFAQTKSNEIITPFLTKLSELKVRAQQSDEMDLRVSLEKALRAAYDNREINTSFIYEKGLGAYTGSYLGHSYSIPLGSITRTIPINEKVLSDQQADRILLAADNVYRIGETDSYVISTREVINNLPGPSVISSVREQVEAGVKTVPTVESVDYTVINGVYSATVKFSDGKEIAVDVNVLNMDLSIEAIGDLLVKYVLEE